MRIPIVLSLLFFSVLILGTVHVLALEFSLYFYFVWLDIPVHALGGIVVALALFSLYATQSFVPERYLEFVPTILIVFIVGLSWEAFEIWAGIPLLEDDFEKDLVYDLVMDMVGASIGWFVGTKMKYLESLE